jgi:GNAT superfamily N-acetyltransferase
MTETQARLDVLPLTPDRWADLESLFGASGAFSGCWCMWWRVTRAEFARQSPNKGAGNKQALKALIDSGAVPGLLAYVDGEPAAWCSVGPREDFGALERSTTLKRVDDKPVWSVVCVFIARPYRGQGLTASLLEAAFEFAAENGSDIVEGYPYESTKTRRPGGTEAFMGFTNAFGRAGYTEAARVSDRRLIMRRCTGNG